MVAHHTTAPPQRKLGKWAKSAKQNVPCRATNTWECPWVRVPNGNTSPPTSPMNKSRNRNGANDSGMDENGRKQTECPMRERVQGPRSEIARAETNTFPKGKDLERACTACAHARTCHHMHSCTCHHQSIARAMRCIECDCHHHASRCYPFLTVASAS